MISYCGLNCTTCPIHLATLEKDAIARIKMREEIARLISEIYGKSMDPADINECDGCLSTEGRLFHGCHDCQIRECVHSRNLNNCADCDDYSCVKLESHFKRNPESRTVLEKIRRESKG